MWDTTITKTTPDEVLFVVGHELGHYVLGHVPTTGFLFSSRSALCSRLLHYFSRAWHGCSAPLGRRLENLWPRGLGLPSGDSVHPADLEIFGSSPS